MPKVSIIMATYNCQDTVKNSIESILNQTYQDWEFIICDDCSTDQTYDILLQYQERYPQKIIILRNKKNSKLSYSLNRCLQVANGEYIARMDADDESLPERLKQQVNFLDNHLEYSVVGTAMTPFDENGKKPTRYAKEVPAERDMLNRSPFFHATILMRKEAYEQVDGYTVSKRTVRAQDYDMWFRFFAHGLKGYNLQESYYLVLEDTQAIKRRTFKARCYEVQTKIKGYRLLRYPWYLYFYAFKPILAALTPVGVMQKYHRLTDARSKKQKEL